MERLTIRNSDGSVSQPTGLNWADALNRLAAYEDTGMTPKEVHDMLEREVPKKPGIHRAYEEDEEYIYFKCPNYCAIYCEVYPQDKYCRRCGQKLDWSEEEKTNESMDKIPEEW